MYPSALLSVPSVHLLEAKSFDFLFSCTLQLLPTIAIDVAVAIANAVDAVAVAHCF
jgi:hypothetical protein